MKLAYSFTSAVDKWFCAIFSTDCWGSVHKVISDLSNKLILTKGKYGASTVRRNGDFLYHPQHEMSFLDGTKFELEDEETPEMEIIFSAPITPGMTCTFDPMIFQKNRCLPLENVRS